MKIIIFFLASLFIIGIIALGIWLFVFPHGVQPNNNSESIPVFNTPSAQTGENQNTNTKEISSSTQQTSTQQAVQQTFLNQSRLGIGPVPITLSNAIVVFPYAVQGWGLGDSAGEALLQYDSLKGWVLITDGGGAWSVGGLVEMEGVPTSTAQQLIAGLQQ